MDLFLWMFTHCLIGFVSQVHGKKPCPNTKVFLDLKLLFFSCHSNSSNHDLLITLGGREMKSRALRKMVSKIKQLDSKHFKKCFYLILPRFNGKIISEKAFSRQKYLTLFKKIMFKASQYKGLPQSLQKCKPLMLPAELS